MKNKLLLLTPELPYPLQSGGKIKTWNMICALSKQWQVTLVCPLKESDPDYLQEFLSKAPINELISEPVSVPRNAKNLLKSYCQFKPLNLLRTYSETLSDKVEAIANEYSLILVDHFEVFQFLPKSFVSSKQRPPIIYHAHNAYHQIWQRYSETTTNIAEKIVCAIESYRVCAYEKLICKQADLVFAAPNDIETLKKVGCQPHKFSETLHLGDGQEAEQPDLEVRQTTNKLCYAGFLGWEPNVQGLLWFLKEVWPTVSAMFPDLRFDIAGKNPDARLVDAVDQLPKVRLLGFVEDLETLYKESRIAVCPLLFGSGIKVKVAQSMARGIPTVTTKVGAEGLDVVHGVHLIISDQPSVMAEAIKSLLINDPFWQRVSYASRKLMRDRYSWDAVFDSMNKAIQATCHAHSQAHIEEPAMQLA